ncbi:MAG: multidrug efflux MFS transporter [Chloroflexi bacterium]|nr:multidrug efflux MFS transporter [Chloroflexota bacterium]
MGGVLRTLRGIEYKYFVAAAFVFGAFMEILDTTIVNVALPTLGNEFHANTSSLEWVVTGYLLSLAVWIPASGWIGDRFGTKRTFLFATMMFIVGSALCGRAWSVESLALFRVIQGVGGGMMTPVGTAMMFRAFTIRERARASAYLAVPTQIAPMLGPLFGGFLVTNVNWRWIFYVNVPIGVLSFLFSLVVLQEHREANAGRFDPAGFLLSGAGLAGILFALSQGPEVGWTAPHVLASLLGGIGCFVALVFVERWVKAPMLDLSLFRTPMFAQGNVIAFSLFAAQNGVLFLLPLFLQDLRGLTALQSGLITFVQPLATISMAQFTSRMYLKLGPRVNLMACTFGIMTTSILLAFVTLDTNLWLIRGIMLVRGASGAFMMVSVQTTAFAQVSRERMGRASSLFNVQRQSAASFGVAVLATVLIATTHAFTGGAAGPAAARGSLLAFHAAFAGAAVIALIGFLLATRVNDEQVLREKRIDATGPAAATVVTVRDPERLSASSAG